MSWRRRKEHGEGSGPGPKGETGAAAESSSDGPGKEQRSDPDRPINRPPASGPSRRF